MDGVAAGGMMAMEAEWGEAPSHWANYIAVDNADETAEKINPQMAALCRFRRLTLPASAEWQWSADPSGADFAIIQFVAPA